MVIINGESKDLSGKTITDLIEGSDFNHTRIAIELNGSIVPKSKYGSTVLKDNDNIEVVSLVGGG